MVAPNQGCLPDSWKTPRVSRGAPPARWTRRLCREGRALACAVKTSSGLSEPTGLDLDSQSQPLAPSASSRVLSPHHVCSVSTPVVEAGACFPVTAVLSSIVTGTRRCCWGPRRGERCSVSAGRALGPDRWPLAAVPLQRVVSGKLFGGLYSV